MILSETKLDEVLRAQNPWWISGALPQRARHTQERPCDRFLRETERPALLTGPRRSGKTATLLRLVDARLRASERPRDIAYVPLDHPILRLVPLGLLVDRVIRLTETEGRPQLLLDGLQAVPHWPERFVELVKTRPHPRLVAAVSVASGVEEPEFDTVQLSPLSFHEFCALRGVPELGAPALDPLDPRLPDDADALDDLLYHRVLDPVLADYLVRGGFPEAVLEPDLSTSHQMVREGVVARAVYQDLPSVVGVLKLADLERVLLTVLLQGGAPLTLEAFADALELDRQTVARYLEHLGRAHLVASLRNFAALTDRSRPRVYPVDPALPNALFERGAAVLADTDARRSLLAGAVVAHVAQVARERGFDVAYFREGELEADAVLVSPSGAVPIVILDRDDVAEEDAAGVERVMKRCQAHSAFLLSRWGPRRRAALTFFETVYHLPMAYFLYALRA